jgi:hypothetical protein
MAYVLLIISGTPETLWLFPYDGNSAAIDAQFLTPSTSALLTTCGKTQTIWNKNFPFLTHNSVDAESNIIFLTCVVGSKRYGNCGRAKWECERARI